jgi:hypothetical protein
VKSEKFDGQDRRQHFRVKYPFSERPQLVITRDEFDILDISEQGIRFSMGPIIGETITFHDGESLNLEGKLLRTQDSEVVIQLLKGIPPERISKEQRYLMNKYAGYR